MSIINLEKLTESKREYEKYKKLIHSLDSVGDILYNDLNDGGVWELLKSVESLKFDYYIKLMSHEDTIQNKGYIDE